jgi:hypothetical protein
LHGFIRDPICVHFETISDFPMIAPNRGAVRLCDYQKASSLIIPITAGDAEVRC